MKARTLFIPVLVFLTGASVGWLFRGVDPGEWSGESEEGGERSSGPQMQRPGEAGGVGTDLWHRPSDREGRLVNEDEDKILVDPGAVAELLESEVTDLERRSQLVVEDEPLARFLAIEADEVEALNRLWQDLRPKLTTLRIRHLRQEEYEDGRVWIGVEPFPEEGNRLRKEFLLTTINLLGEARSKAFLDAIEAHGAFGRWGKTVGGGFSIQVRVQDDGEYLYQITEQVRADGRPGRTWQTSKIPAHLRDLAKAAGIALKL